MSKFKEYIHVVLASTLLIGAVWQTFTVLDYYANQETTIEVQCVHADNRNQNSKTQIVTKNQLDSLGTIQEESQSTSSNQVESSVDIIPETGVIASEKTATPKPKYNPAAFI